MLLVLKVLSIICIFHCSGGAQNDTDRDSNSSLESKSSDSEILKEYSNRSVADSTTQVPDWEDHFEEKLNETINDPMAPGNPGWEKQFVENLTKRIDDPMEPRSPGWEEQFEEYLSKSIDDPMAPGNLGWEKQLDESLSETIDDPMSPGNPEWEKQFEENLSKSVDDPMAPGNPGWENQFEENLSKTVDDPMAQGNPGWEKQFEENLSKIVDDPMAPGNPGWQKQFEENLSKTVNKSIAMKSSAWEKKFDEKLKKINSHAFPPSKEDPILIPEFPKNFPYPPVCKSSKNPGLKYPEKPSENYNSNGQSNSKVVRSTFICSDPRYKRKFYLLKTKLVYEVLGKTANKINTEYYTLKGKSFKYRPDVKYVPLFPDE